MTVTFDGSSLNSVNTISSLLKTSTDSSSEKTSSLSSTLTQNYDILELSENYLSSVNSETEEETSTEAITETEEETSDETDVNASELYIYSDSELSDLLREGSITRAEYNAEMAKRAE